MNQDRLRHGWSYSDLAREAGCSVQTVSRFFSGAFQTPKSAKKLAIALGFPLARYVKGAKPEQVTA